MLKKIVFAAVAALGFTAALAVVNVNTATEAELMTLNGVGEKTAKDIIAYRTEHGPFKSVDDLKKVKGIKDKKLDKFKTEISVTGNATTQNKVQPAQKQPQNTSDKK